MDKFKEIRPVVIGIARNGNRILVSEDLIKTGQPLSRLWINGYLGGVPELI